MGRRPQPPVFVARATYRQRRLRDALRLVPVLGAVLWLMPLLWTRASDTGADVALPGDAALAMPNSTALIYVFGAWAGLIFLAWALARFLRDDAPASEPEDTD